MLNKVVKTIINLYVFFLFCILFSGCQLLPNEDPVSAPPLVKPEKVQYETSLVKRQDLVKSIKVNGIVVSSKQVPVFFRQLTETVGRC